MKKTLIFGTCTVFALLLALVFSACPTESKSSPTVTITITGLVSPPLPAGSKYYSISVFAEAQDIKKGGSLTQLVGDKANGVGEGPASGNASISVPEIPGGSYVLVLGASADQKSGEMFITGTGSGAAANATPVLLDFSTGTATVSFAQFATKDASSGWSVDEIVNRFGSSN